MWVISWDRRRRLDVEASDVERCVDYPTLATRIANSDRRSGLLRVVTNNARSDDRGIEQDR